MCGRRVVSTERLRTLIAFLSDKTTGSRTLQALSCDTGFIRGNHLWQPLHDALSMMHFLSNFIFGSPAGLVSVDTAPRFEASSRTSSHCFAC